MGTTLDAITKIHQCFDGLGIEYDGMSTDTELTEILEDSLELMEVLHDLDLPEDDYDTIGDLVVAIQKL